MRDLNPIYHCHEADSKVTTLVDVTQGFGTSSNACTRVLESLVHGPAYFRFHNVYSLKL